MDTTQRIARIAGWIYLLFAIVSAFSFLYVPSTVFVSGNATATANNIMSSEFLYRVGVLGSYLSQVLFVFLVLTLYRLFKAVDPMPALLMLTLVSIAVAITFVILVNRLVPLVLLGGADYLSVFARPQLEAWAYASLRFYSQGSQASTMLWGLWLFPFGLLVIRSRFIPRLLGILLYIAGVGYVLNSFTALLLPHYLSVVSQITTPMIIGELPIILWLLIMGARKQPELVMARP